MIDHECDEEQQSEAKQKMNLIPRGIHTDDGQLETGGKHL